MKIAFLGNFEVEYSTENHHKQTYEDLGHSVICLQENKATADQVLDAARKSDILIWTHTHGWDTPGMVKVLHILKNEGIPTAGYHLDLWLGLDRQKDLDSDPYWNIQYFFTVDKRMAEYMNEREHLPKAFYLPAGVVKSECYLGEYREELASDVIFVGSKGYHQEWPYRPKLIQWLHDTYGARFRHWGGDGAGTIRGKDLNDLYASAKVVVGDTLCPGFNYPWYFSDRLFETTGRGGFMIFPWIMGVDDMFKEEEELVTYPFEAFDELERLINYYIENEDEREKIRLAGHKRTKKDHTYNNRLKEMLKVIENEKTS